MIELILAMIAPFAVKSLTEVVKKVPTIVAANGWRVPVIRAVVAVLSLTGAILTQAIGEGQLDPSLVETTVFTVFNAVAATVLYFITKK